MIILKYFEYCFYKLTNSKLFQKADKKEPHLAPRAWVTLCQACNILAIIETYIIISNIKFDIKNFKYTWIPICITLYLANTFFFLTKNKYKELTIRYKDEKHKKLKGWGVFLYVLLSILMWGVVSIKLFWVPKI